jgi:hypothetical protein
MTTPADDALTVLGNAGFPVDALSDQEREVFASLTADEVTLLLSLKERFDAAAPEVQPHSGGVYAGGVMF